MAGEDEKKPESWFQPKVEPKKEIPWEKTNTPYEYTPGKGWEAKPSEKAAPEVKAEVQIFSKEGEGYAAGGTKKGQGKYGSYTASGGAGYGKAGAKSVISIDLEKKTADITPIKVEVSGAVLQGKVEGEFSLGKWFKALFEHKPVPPPPVAVPPFAARVTDLTSHGTPLAPGIGSPNVIIGFLPAWRQLLDTHVCPVPGHGVGKVLQGCPTVLINGVQACRAGDKVVEIPPGPDPIAMGCTTVLIGQSGSGGSEGDEHTAAEVKDKAEGSEDPELAVKGSAEAKYLTAEAALELSATASKDAIGVKAKAGALAAYAKGSVEGGITIPIPFTKHAVTLGGKAEGTLLSAGVEGEAAAGWTAAKGYQATLGAKVGAGLGGVGLGFSIGFK